MDNVEQGDSIINKMLHRLFLLLILVMVICLSPEAAESAMTIRVVPPISSARILPTGPVTSGRVSSELSIIACRGEYEPASFVITADSRIDSLQVQAGDLEGPGGIIPTRQIDIKVVKCWYQSGSKKQAADKELGKRVLVPALLLNDDSLVKVDYRKKENYLKVPLSNQDKYIWVSNPDEKQGDNPPIPSREFPLKDSPVLLPVNISANANKQFWLTVHVPQDAQSGNYSGRITLSTPAEQLYLRLKLRVLPFELLTPYYTSAMFYRNPEGPQLLLRYRKDMENLIAHGVTNPIYYPAGPKWDDKFLRIRQELGMAGGPVYTIQDAASPVSIIYEQLNLFRSYGFTDVYFAGTDEASGDRLVAQIPGWKRTKAAGGKIWASGNKAAGYKGKSKFETVGDILDVFNCPHQPSRDEAAKWHGAGHRIFCYENPCVGQDDPQIYRRNYGIVHWKNDYDGIGIYAYRHHSGNPYNDFDGGMRELNVAYPTIDGVIDTVVWEGYREGIDDVRYLTTLTKAIEIAKRSSNETVRKVSAQAEKYLDELTVEQADLDAVRTRMIQYLEKLQGGSDNSSSGLGRLVK